MPDVHVVTVDAADPQAVARVHAIRFEVFVDEQGVAPSDELDDRDYEPGTRHLLAVRETGSSNGVQDLGTARLLDDGPGMAHASRVAVRSLARGLGVGRVLMTALEREALAAHADRCDPADEIRMVLSAQESALGFYAALGYAVSTKRYQEAGIWHRDAVKMLRPGGS
ncbi:GNAT family N-acetyltransferase [Ruania alkalisoli]|uniref:GNAT family N-acetyltransferase n=1 Tax=Ruania alkalisoli TaxID=2779775 RepID=A0A7M1SX45_9MICO|nr:GNAT family N-acetyltransferase [Ruania alkalisoli]QOR72160.1 GNAT family N-acetyltransferase [Ruania alkalisoli]